MYWHSIDCVNVLCTVLCDMSAACSAQFPGIFEGLHDELYDAVPDAITSIYYKCAASHAVLIRQQLTHSNSVV